MDRFQDTSRISSHRLHGWDYSQNGTYFITTVIQSREFILGQIENQKMALSDFGKIVNVEWFKSFKIRNELFLNEFIIIPKRRPCVPVVTKYRMNAKFEKENIAYFPKFVCLHKIEPERFSSI